MSPAYGLHIVIPNPHGSSSCHTPGNQLFGDKAVTHLVIKFYLLNVTIAFKTAIYTDDAIRKTILTHLSVRQRKDCVRLTNSPY